LPAYLRFNPLFHHPRTVPDELADEATVFAFANPSILPVVLKAPGVTAFGDAGHSVAGVPGVGVSAVCEQVALDVVGGHRSAGGAVIHLPVLGGGVAVGVGGLHVDSLSTWAHVCQALDGAIFINAGVLTVDGDVGVENARQLFSSCYFTFPK
jgi:hypothetical protein